MKNSSDKCGCRTHFKMIKNSLMPVGFDKHRHSADEKRLLEL